MAAPSPKAMHVTLESDSARSTERVARGLASKLRPGDVVLIEGDLGTGKTTFVRGACAALGVLEQVTSPSFTIGRRYEGGVAVSHLDLFRLETLESEDPALLDDYLTSDAITFVEWPETAAHILEPQSIALRIQLSHQGGDMRSLRLEGRSEILEGIENDLRTSK
jgi:tRNA threonylcarbamoyladenosine biosynthesis protein TsaE